ncbi:MAG: T9SS type A sorting domain-containing protein, partial [Bacteroidota bacterium]
QRLLILFVCSLLALSVNAQTTLPTQAAVNSFPTTITHIQGSLNIGGSAVMSDITNLAPLANIVSIGGDLNITFNGNLTNLSGLNNLLSVGGRVYITNNPKLNSCTSILPLLENAIVSNNTNGCNSVEEVIKDFNRCGGVGNRQDSDGDGVFDCADGCPNNPDKIVSGACGCHDTFGEGDSDGDGTPDCKDGCPYDSNKIAEGTCGCGNLDTDSDGDGTADCVDQCLANPNVVEKGVCGCEAPMITDVRMQNAGGCHNQNTNDDADDTYQATVTVSFAYPPRLGAIRIKGSTNHRFDFVNENDTQTIFNFELPFPADGQKVDFTVEYIGNETCKYRFQQAVNLAPCSDLVCDIPSNVGAEVEGNQVVLKWDYVADWMSYEYRYRLNGAIDWTYQWTDQSEVIICDLVKEQAYEYQVRSYCGNNRKSAYAQGRFVAGTDDTDCLPSRSVSNCLIQNLEVVNITNCHDRGTGYQEDDFFYADVVVYFQHPPTFGTLTINGNATTEVAVSALQTSTKYRFSRLKLMENGSRIDLTATFSADESCQFNIDYPIPANPCIGSLGRSRTMDTPITDLPVDGIAISPNPSNGVINLTYNFGKTTNPLRLVIYDHYGQAVLKRALSTDTNNASILLTNLQKGMYYMRVTDGQTQRVEKFLLQ